MSSLSSGILKAIIGGHRRLSQLGHHWHSPTMMAVLLIGGCFLLSNAQSAETDGNPNIAAARGYDPIAELTTGRSGSRLATPVRLPFERDLPGPITDWVLLTASGDCNQEYNLHVQPLGAKGFQFAQRTGRAANNVKAWWILANRSTGQGLALMLAYMGNWDFAVQSRGQGVVVHLATSPPNLHPFITIQGLPIPGALISEFTGHWDYGTQPIVRFIREKLLRDLGPQWPLVQYNSWYDADDKITQQRLIGTARAAAAIGCELFTVDAGWFGEGIDADWGVATGDWEVNRSRFPDGLEIVASEVRQLGMNFGLWFEIECAHPSSRLAKDHPDWFLVDSQKKRLGARDVLDFGKPEVLAHAKSVIDRFMAKYLLDYVKMDFNVDPAIENSALTQATDPLYGHYRGLAELWTYMRTKHPSLIVENCSSGSLRQELTSVALTDTHWVSDNIDNRANLVMAFGANYLFPPSVCSHWTTKLDRSEQATDLDAQFAVNMMGHLGVSGKITSWDPEAICIAQARIAQYKRIRSVIRGADVFHLTSQHLGFMQAAMYVDAATDRALLFAFHSGDPEMKHVIRLRGLDPAQHYRLSVPVGAGQLDLPTGIQLWLPDTAVGAIVGKDLTEQGVTVTFPHSGACVVVEIEMVGR